MPTDPFLDADLAGDRLYVFPQNRWSPIRRATAVAGTREDPVSGFAVTAILLPFQKRVCDVRIEGHRFLRGLGFARTDDPADNGASDAHRLEFEINVEPFEAKQLTLPKAGGGG
ncbi:MAG: hypothetical protein ABSD59_25875 [Terracidiphilus sp.]